MNPRRMSSGRTKPRFDPTLTDSEGRTIYHFIFNKDPTKAMCGTDMGSDGGIRLNGRPPKGKAWTICPLCQLQAELLGFELKPDCSGFRPISAMR